MINILSNKSLKNSGQYKAVNFIAKMSRGFSLALLPHLSPKCGLLLLYLYPTNWFNKLIYIIHHLQMSVIQPTHLQETPLIQPYPIYITNIYIIKSVHIKVVILTWYSRGVKILLCTLSGWIRFIWNNIKLLI